MSALETLRWIIFTTPRLWKRVFLIGFDFLALMFALWASYALRYADWTPQITEERLLLGLLAPLIAIPVFIRMGLYRAVLRYLPDTAIWTILHAMAVSTIAWVIFVFMTAMAGRDIVPRSVPFFYFAIGVLIIGGSRFAAKLILSTGTGMRRDEHPMLIYGAGPSSVQLATVLRGHGKRYVVGLVDDDPQHHGRDVGGYRVFPPVLLPRLIEKYGVREIILSMSSIPIGRRHAVISLVSGLGVKIRTLPDITDLVDGRYLVNQIREIEIDELLGRSFVPPDQNLLRGILQDKVVMVTGAGGSIGSELCRLIMQWKPKRLVLFEANEFALYKIDRELRSAGHFDVIPVLASVRDAGQVRSAITRNGVEVLYHAAAHKHVPLVEANAFEGIGNNIFGTLAVADVALSAGVENFVLISSDKAVRPTNVMGATKRWAELIIQDKAIAAAKQGGQHFCAVRFGNVVGSNGSVVPLFREQIANGGPVTVTDPDMTRYFMSIQEAAELIVQASAMSLGGDTFLLDMGQPVRIGELAENMIRLAGFTVRKGNGGPGSIEVQVTGVRPGEKLFEELFYDVTSALKTEHPKIMRSEAKFAGSGISEALRDLQAAMLREDETAVRKILFDFIDLEKGPIMHPAPVLAKSVV